MAEKKVKIPRCPLLSAGMNDVRVCLQEDCAWWMKNTKTCAIYVIAHNNMLSIREKQSQG